MDFEKLLQISLQNCTSHFVKIFVFLLLFLLEICKSCPSVAFQTIILRNFTKNKFGKKSTHFFSKIWFQIYEESSYGSKLCGNVPLNSNILTHLKGFEFVILKRVRALKKQFWIFFSSIFAERPLFIQIRQMFDHIQTCEKKVSLTACF